MPVLYEPRSLWSIGYTTQDVDDPATSIRLNRQHFMNGSKWPITLERLVIAPVNYIVRRCYTIADFGHYLSAMILNRVRVSIATPFQQHYSGSQRFIPANVAPLPRYTPPVRSTPLTPPQPSSMFGICVSEFDKILEVPRDGQIEFKLVAVPPSGLGAPLNTTLVQAFVGFQDASSVRGNGWTYPTTQTTVGYPGGYQLEEGYPYPYDPWGAVVGVPAQPPGAGEGSIIDIATWRSLEISGSSFSAQSTAKSSSSGGEAGGTSKLTSMAVMINQIGYDATANAQYAGDPVEPLSSRAGTSVRNITGSDEYWWRPGAPMSLVCDKITPALVYALPKPIILDPGDTLDIIMDFPAGPTVEEPDNPIPIQIGVSLNGYATIEDAYYG